MDSLKEKLLALEYDYAKASAQAAMEDRHKMVNFFVSFFGIVFSAIFGLANFTETPDQEVIFIILFAGFFVGFLFFMNIVRLRQAWYGSVQAMNALKSYVFAQDPEDKAFQAAFVWKARTIPRPGKGWTTFFFSAVTVAFLNSILFSSAFAYLFPGTAMQITAFFAVFALEIGLYFFMLRKNK